MPSIAFLEKVFLDRRASTAALRGVESFNLRLVRELCGLGVRTTLFAEPSWAGIVAREAPGAENLRVVPCAGFGSSLFALLLCGGCSGSTAGGVKVVRWAVLFKQAGCELRRLVHPRGVYVVRVDGVPVRDGLVAGVGAFLFAYLALCGATALAGVLAGLPPWEALSASLSMVGNVGPAFGSLGPTDNYGALPAALKWWYCFAMLAGRLEIYTLLVLAARPFLRFGRAHA